MKSVEYLDANRRKYNCSDYKAAQLLQVTKQTVSHVRGGRSFSEKTAIRAAELLNLDPAEVLIATHLERVKDANARKILQRVVKGLHRGAAAALVLGSPFALAAWAVHQVCILCQMGASAGSGRDRRAGPRL